MALPPLVELSDLEARLGSDPLTGNEQSRAEAILVEASTLVRVDADRDFANDHGDLDFGDLGDRAIDALQQVTLQVAYRAFRNPDGASQISVGDVSTSFRREGQAGAVFLSRAEKWQIRKAVGDPGFGTIRLETPYTLQAVEDVI